MLCGHHLEVWALEDEIHDFMSSVFDVVSGSPLVRRIVVCRRYALREEQDLFSFRTDTPGISNIMPHISCSRVSRKCLGCYQIVVKVSMAPLS